MTERIGYSNNVERKTLLDKMAIEWMPLDSLREFKTGFGDPITLREQMSAGCSGIITKPLVWLLGEGKYLRPLSDIERALLDQNLETIKDTTAWENLSAGKQIYMHDLTSRLAIRHILSTSLNPRRNI